MGGHFVCGLDDAVEGLVQGMRDPLDGVFNGSEISNVFLGDADGHIFAGHFGKLLGDVVDVVIQNITGGVKALRQPAQLIVGIHINMDLQIAGFQLFRAGHNFGDGLQRLFDADIHNR